MGLRGSMEKVTHRFWRNSMDYNGGALTPTGMGGEMLAGVANVPTLKQRLDWAVKKAEQNLADAQKARDILDKNPYLEVLLNIMQKGNF